MEYNKCSCGAYTTFEDGICEQCRQDEEDSEEESFE